MSLSFHFTFEIFFYDLILKQSFISSLSLIGLGKGCVKFCFLTRSAFEWSYRFVFDPLGQTSHINFFVSRLFNACGDRLICSNILVKFVILILNISLPVEKITTLGFLYNN
jgi:hypothetical protein